MSYRLEYNYFLSQILSLKHLVSNTLLILQQCSRGAMAQEEEAGEGRRKEDWFFRPGRRGMNCRPIYFLSRTIGCKSLRIEFGCVWFARSGNISSQREESRSLVRVHHDRRRQRPIVLRRGAPWDVTSEPIRCDRRIRSRPSGLL